MPPLVEPYSAPNPMPTLKFGAAKRSNATRGNENAPRAPLLGTPNSEKLLAVVD